MEFNVIVDHDDLGKFAIICHNDTDSDGVPVQHRSVYRVADIDDRHNKAEYERFLYEIFGLSYDKWAKDNIHVVTRKGHKFNDK